MARIVTHLCQDMDSLFAVAAFEVFMNRGKPAEICRVPANWDGADLEEEDVALDIDAGGRGLKGHRDPDGKVHSAFGLVVERFASPEDKRALERLVEYVDACDSAGSAARTLLPGHDRESYFGVEEGEIRLLIAGAHLEAKGDEDRVQDFVRYIFRLKLEMGRKRARSEEMASRCVRPHLAVAIVVNAPSATTPLFEGGEVRFIVFVDGKNIGIARETNETMRVDAPEVRAVVEAAGEKISPVGVGVTNEWFAHSAGFLFSRGTKKSPVETPSKVRPEDLATALIRAIEREEKAKS